MGNYVTGDSGSIVFSGAEGIVVADFGAWNATFSRDAHPTTPFQYQTGRVTLGRLNARGNILQWIDAIKPPLPANGSVSGTLTLRVNGSIAYGPFKARLYNLSMTGNANTGEPFAPQYQFVSSADSASDTIS